MVKVGGVLNLIINGIPSILAFQYLFLILDGCFKPYYKWNTFNTSSELNLDFNDTGVLNLIINGIPSIQNLDTVVELMMKRFKPYYKWNTFNTLDLYKDIEFMVN